MKFRPHDEAFVELAAAIGPRELLETALRNYSVLSKGERIIIDVADAKYALDVMEVKPSSRISLFGNLDLEVDFAPIFDDAPPAALPILGATPSSTGAPKGASALPSKAAPAGKASAPPKAIAGAGAGAGVPKSALVAKAAPLGTAKLATVGSLSGKGAAIGTPVRASLAGGVSGRIPVPTGECATLSRTGRPASTSAGAALLAASVGGGVISASVAARGAPLSPKSPLARTAASSSASAAAATTTSTTTAARSPASHYPGIMWFPGMEHVVTGQHGFEARGVGELPSGGGSTRGMGQALDFGGGSSTSAAPTAAGLGPTPAASLSRTELAALMRQAALQRMQSLPPSESEGKYSEDEASPPLRATVKDGWLSAAAAERKAAAASKLREVAHSSSVSTGVGVGASSAGVSESKEGSADFEHESGSHGKHYASAGVPKPKLASVEATPSLVTSADGATVTCPHCSVDIPTANAKLHVLRCKSHPGFVRVSRQRSGHTVVRMYSCLCVLQLAPPLRMCFAWCCVCVVPVRIGVSELLGHAAARALPWQ